jgi:hypothetical protein
MNQQAEIKLAAPGAGLPPVERFIGSLLFKLQWKIGSREKFTENFQRERASIRHLIEKFSSENAGKRVLIERPIGLEDSSRYWSLWMTLDHLRIVNTGVQEIILSLSQGIVPTWEVSTATVKPSPDVTQAIVKEYETSCENLLNAVAKVSELKTKERCAHPWFGPMNAYEWYGLAGGHLGAHRVQIERILAGLRAS